MKSPIDFDELMAAAHENMFGLGTAGFCKKCGAQRDGCEPDARGLECWDCGQHAVDGVELLILEQDLLWLAGETKH